MTSQSPDISQVRENISMVTNAAAYGCGFIGESATLLVNSECKMLPKQQRKWKNDATTSTSTGNKLSCL
jgi:hypothetical protein